MVLGAAMWWMWMVACATKVEPAPEPEPEPVPWSRELEPASGIGAVRGFSVKRAITHLHSPWSHDACDGNGLPDGAPNLPCLMDLREGLCATRVDLAFVTDHPSHSADQAYEDLFIMQPGDSAWPAMGAQRANQIHCDDGHIVTWMPGVEDALMPLGLDRQVGEDVDESMHIYKEYTPEAVALETEAGALVFVAHTEERDGEVLAELQDAGLVGVEVFNLHAMFDPFIREEVLGLDGLGWLPQIAPFTDMTGTAEPDLFVLAVLQEQPPSLARYDELLARGPTVAIAGTDAHQNVLALELRDGERGDSYRRMLRWFSNHVLVEGAEPDAVEEALGMGRSYVAFEVLGTPVGFSFSYELAGAVTEMGGEAAVGGELVLDCPTLSAASPKSLDAPEISATIFRNGEVWQTACGRFAVEEPGDYRVRVDIVPHHLAGFLGAEPEVWVHSYPWIYSNALRIR